MKWHLFNSNEVDRNIFEMSYSLISHTPQVLRNRKYKVFSDLNVMLIAYFFHGVIFFSFRETLDYFLIFVLQETHYPVAMWTSYPNY
jgi:hypothetical protein